jgi:hypothetical protein
MSFNGKEKKMGKKSYPAFEWQLKKDDVTLTIRAKTADDLWSALDYIKEHNSDLIPDLWQYKNKDEEGEASDPLAGLEDHEQ